MYSLTKADLLRGFSMEEKVCEDIADLTEVAFDRIRKKDIIALQCTELADFFRDGVCDKCEFTF